MLLHCCSEYKPFYSFHKRALHPLLQQLHFRVNTQQKQSFGPTKAVDQNLHSTFIKK